MRSIYIDIFRCIAILLLLLAHISQITGSPFGLFFGIPNFYWVSLGGFAVTLFLVISGAAIELTYSQSKISFFHFLAKRVLRIYPLYYLSLLLGLIVYGFKSYYVTGHIFSFFSRLSPYDIFLSLTAGYAFAGKWGGPFLTTSWFIILIMTLYIFYPFLSWIINKRPALSFAVLLGISVISRLILGSHNILPYRPLDWFPLCRVFEFSLGIYLVKYRPKNIPDSFKVSAPLSSVILWISMISFPLFLVHYPLIFIIPLLAGHGISTIFAIVLFLLISVLFSWLILKLDQRFPRSALLKRLEPYLSK